MSQPTSDSSGGTAASGLSLTYPSTPACSPTTSASQTERTPGMMRDEHGAMASHVGAEGPSGHAEGMVAGPGFHLNSAFARLPSANYHWQGGGVRVPGMPSNGLPSASHSEPVHDPSTASMARFMHRPGFAGQTIMGRQAPGLSMNPQWFTGGPMKEMFSQMNGLPGPSFEPMLEGGLFEDIPASAGAPATQSPYAGIFGSDAFQLETRAFLDKLKVELLDGLRTEIVERLHAEVSAELKKAAQETVRNLMGMREKAPHAPGVRKKAYVLPDPLPEGEPPRSAPDGTRLFNPEWTMDVDKGVNRELVQAAVAVVRQNADDYKVQPREAEDEDALRTAVVTYLQGLKRQYQTSHDESLANKRQKKLVDDKHHARRHRKADWIRMGLLAFRRAFGFDLTVGVDELVHTPWQSDEHSDEGEATHEEWRAMRLASQAGPNALEVRGLTWRSRKLLTLYVVLSVFARFSRDFPDLAARDPAVGVNGEDLSADADALANARAQYLDEVISAAKEWRTIYANNWQHLGRFRGPAINNREVPRADRRYTIFKDCFSQKWAKRSPEHARLYAKALEVPETFTVFDLEIPEELIPEDDREWLNSLLDDGEELNGSGDESAREE
ncbi:hypothetical protein C8Q77DRAFT_1160339 [Trametes polyzona]|nr:hypothetical protein C8Q77DRAFT_1160339 [Trametes polyzona]